MTSTPTRRTLSTAALLLVLTTSACSLRPEDLPSVRGGIGSSYEITIELESAMNLPSGADVILDGIRVGEVGDIDVEAGGVAVVAAVGEDTRVPSDIRAIVRQNTLLGDTYVALVREPDSRATGFLGEGDTVPLARTTSPPQLEDTMAVLATFVNGGSIQRVQDVMAKVNTVMPPVPEIRNLAAVVSTDLRDLAGRTAEIDRFLNGINAAADSVNANGDSLAILFDTSTVHYWRRLATSVVSHIGQILPSVGSLYAGGLWLVPMFESLADTTDISLSDASAAAQLSDFARTKVIPFAARPEVDIVGLESESGGTLADTENVLRVLGAVR